MTTHESSPRFVVESYLDEAGPERLRGWVWAPEHPDEAARIDVLDRFGQVAAQTTATLFRGDLQSAGKRGGACGFEMPVPPSGGPFRVLAVFPFNEGAADVLGEDIRGRPSPDEHPSRLSGPGGITGWIDRAAQGDIRGWCHRPTPISAPVELELVELEGVRRGRVVAEARADIWRNDLEDLRQGDGRCGFRFELPIHLFDGAEHAFELRLAGGPPLLAEPLRMVMPDAPPAHPAPPVARRPAPDATPVISILVNFYNMRREAERTLHSLSRAFQQGVEDIPFEVLCIDNGSNPPLEPDFVARFGPEFRLFRPSVVKPSPCTALNEAATAARGRWIAVMIDGAHLVSPGVIAEAHAALQSEPGAIVALRQWFIGGDQRWFSTVGYSREHEDVLFARVNWPDSGYEIFSIASPMYESPNSWFDGMSESNCLFLPAELYGRLGGLDEAFDTPGAGFANLDLFRRAADAADAVVALVGEASFHQYHGGMTTNVDDEEKDARVRSYASRYAQMRGAEFASLPPDRIRVSGVIKTAAALTARQWTPAPLRQGLTGRLRPRPLAIQFDEDARRYLQAAYVETGRHRETRWRGRQIDLAPPDLTDLQEALWRARPQVIVMKDASPALVDFVASILPALELEGARIVWVAPGGGADEPPPPRVLRLDGDSYDPATLAHIEAQIGAAERVLVVFQPRAEDELPVEALARYSRLVTLGSYMFVPGAGFGQPWIGYSRAWIHRAIVRFVQSHPAFVVDRTLNQHLVTTSADGFLRRVLDPLPAERYDSALDDLSGL